MAKKKASKTKSASRTKKKARTASKKTATKKGTAKKKLKTVKKKIAKKKTASKKKKAAPTKRTKTATKKKKAGRSKSLGRPRVTAEAKLDQLFQKDYQAREIFEFLRVGTIRELEQYGPDEIIDRLAGPVIQTVERIRKALAMNNRCLAKDRTFALAFQALLKQR